ncbi:anti-sigma-factor antagonist [Streptomyces sp. 1222.5]|uniref:STAS domain-containing protein n=1 Tax=unclassified Streptomyces TaxID=2593676 RepID=UPI00089592C1|nr:MULTISPECIES: STAS domain-containing protein [unclassified Streptomyces]PKW05330.1 anti-sigma-factor antagonist [Streptomyces sp. 5112.2]SED43192.1 anti-sigma-factor antagonist [Streptomyces sp. 1222.5]
METEHPYQPQPLKVTSTAADGVTVVVVTGEIDHASAGPLIQALDLAGLGERPRVVIDMQHVPFMDSSGINVLLAAHRDLTPLGWLRLAGVTQSVLRTLQIVGVDTVIDCCPSLREALAA